MTLVVEIPDSYQSERSYVLGHVLERRLGLQWQRRVVPGSRSVRITDGSREHAVIVKDGLFDLDEDVRLTDSALPELPLIERMVPGQSRPVPDLFGDRRSVEAMEIRGPEVHVNVDVFGGIFFMLTRLEEVVNPSRDNHGRLPDDEALLVKAGMDEVPLADAYVEILWDAISRVWPRVVRRPAEYSVFLTHDVDRPTAYGERFSARIRSFGGDLAKRKDPLLALRRLVSSVPSMYRRRLDPYDSFEFLMRVSERHGLRSAFFFMADRDRRVIDHPYRLDDAPIPQVMRRAGSGGHEIGVHSGYASFTSAKLISQELEQVQAAARKAGIDQSRWGGRQHYLRWDNPKSWRAWSEAGLDYDSTIAYSRRVGFRAGTCHPYEAFDLVERRPLGLIEIPLIVMDRALYAQFEDPQDRIEAIRRLARQCSAYGGTLTMLWHNDGFVSVPTGWYEDVVGAVVKVGQ